MSPLSSGWFPPWTRMRGQSFLGTHPQECHPSLFNQGETEGQHGAIVLKEILWTQDQNTFEYLCRQFMSLTFGSENL